MRIPSALGTRNLKHKLATAAAFTAMTVGSFAVFGSGAVSAMSNSGDDFDNRSSSSVRFTRTVSFFQQEEFSQQTNNSRNFHRQNNRDCDHDNRKNKDFKRHEQDY
jgi:hypothetical protein